MSKQISIFAPLAHYDDLKKQSALGLNAWLGLFHDLSSRFNLKSRNVGFGFELKSVDWFSRNQFDPKSLLGYPYSIHIPGPILSRLCYDKSIMRGTGWFNHYLEWLASLDPKPVAVIFHGPRYIAGKAIPLDDRRYEFKIEPEKMLYMRQLMMDLFSQWNQDFPVYLENTSITEFAGPTDYGRSWAPITYAAPQLGTHPQELRRYSHRYGVCKIALDLEHLIFNCRFHRNIEEYEFLQAKKTGVFITDKTFFHEFGYEYVINGPIIDNYQYTPSEAIKVIEAEYVHLSGSHQEIASLGPCQYPPEIFIDNLKDSGCFSYQQLYLLENFRVNSHAPISRSDAYFFYLLQQLILNGAHTFVVEVANHTPGDCWWLVTDHDPSISFTNLVNMLCFDS